ncbi:DUF2533 family protein [Pseudalkalibacillus sp. Hm43]|uniref:DUF2533 family protein n=1 Tax=Pseudalkalibacillus sp. Hm43 TaxID=3450742 RepID=UPI003F4302BF
MSVHHEISKHSNDQHARVRQFAQLDEKREQWIEIALKKCKADDDFSEALVKINEVTEQINELARKGIVPQRKNVTKDMIKEYCQKQ